MAHWGFKLGIEFGISRVLDKREFSGTTRSESPFCPRAFLKSKCQMAVGNDGVVVLTARRCMQEAYEQEIWGIC